MEFKTILVPTDFSKHAETAIETAVALAAKFGSSLHLVHAYYLDVPPSYIAGDASGFINPQEILEPIRESAEASMAELTAQLRERGIDVSTRVLMGHPSHVILNEAERLSADTIVIYGVQIGEDIYVLHVFQKKSKRGATTPKPDVGLIKRRYREAQELAEYE